MAEFQVVTNRADAEYGRVTGAVINAVSKSGTNQLRGSVLYFVRNDRFDAPNFFTHVVAPFDEKQSGFTVGGPIVKNRAHFFGAYEYQNRSVTARPNTGVPQFDVDADAGIKRKLPSARADIQLSNNHRMFARGSLFYNNSQNQTVGGNTAVSGGYAEDFDTYDFSFGETWVINSRMVHELRGGLFYFYKNLYESSQQPRYVFPSATLGPATNVPQWWNEEIYQISDALSIFVPSWHGEHRFKTGFQYTLPFYRGELPRISYGQFNFDRNPPDWNNMATWPAPTRYSTTLGDFSYDVDNPIYGAFVQDDWTVARRLTLNFGLRYDVEPKVTNKDIADPLDEGPRHVDGDNFSPRFGFAFDVTGDGRTVIRGGAGRYYGNILLNIPMNEARDRNERVSVVVANPNLFNPLNGLTLEDYLAQNLPRARTLMDVDYDTPVQDQYTIGVARQFGERYAAQADYVHTDGHHLQMSRNYNLFENPALGVPLNPTVAGRPYPQFTDITRYETWGTSRYDALQIGFNGRRGPSHFDFAGNYTLSWTKGHTNANRFGTVNNPFDFDDEYSYLTTDQRHRFQASGTFYLPWDITMSSIFFAGSKKPLNITTSLDPFRTRHRPLARCVGQRAAQERRTDAQERLQAGSAPGQGLPAESRAHTGDRRRLQHLQHGKLGQLRNDLRHQHLPRARIVDQPVLPAAADTVRRQSHLLGRVGRVRSGGSGRFASGGHDEPLLFAVANRCCRLRCARGHDGARTRARNAGRLWAGCRSARALRIGRWGDRRHADGHRRDAPVLVSQVRERRRSVPGRRRRHAAAGSRRSITRGSRRPCRA